LAYKVDQYGRQILAEEDQTATPMLNTRQGRVNITAPSTPTTTTQKPRVLFNGATATKPPPPPPSISNTNPTPPTIIPQQDDVTNQPPEKGPTIGGVSISTVSKLIGAAGLVAGGMAMAENNIVNSGLTAGFQNWIDDTGNQIFGSAFPGAGDPSMVGQTTMSNAMGYGSYGSVLAGLVGLSSGNMIKDGVSGLVGGAVGGAVGGNIGGMFLGIGAGPIGAFIGGFALTAITSMFGPKPSDKTAAGQYNFSTGELISTSLQGKRYSAQNNAARDAYFTGVKSMQGSMSALFGGEFKDMPDMTMEMGGRDGIRVGYGNFKATFNDPDRNNVTDSLEWVGKHMIMGMKNLPPDMETARRNIDYNASFAQVSGDMEYTKDFRSIGDAMIDGSIKMDLDDPEEIERTLTLWSERGNRLGLDQDYINRAISSVRTRRAV
jgi:hypothetical protein